VGPHADLSLYRPANNATTLWIFGWSMHMKMQIRGQAVVETAIYVPLMLMSMFVLWWAAREASTHQRAYSALRYGGEVMGYANPTQGLSMQTLYDTTQDNASYSQGPNRCNYFDVSLLQGTATSLHATETRAPFFKPATCSATCTSTALAMQNGLSRNLMMLAVNGTITADIAADKISPGFLSFLAPYNQVKISQTFFQEPDLKALTHCYAGVYAALNASLYEGAKGVDASTPMWSTSTPYNEAPPTTPLQIGNGCSTSDPAGFSPNAPTSIPALPPALAGGSDGLGSGGTGGGGTGAGLGQTIQ